MIKPWKILSSEYLIQDRWMTMRADRCELPNGVVLDKYYVRENPDFVQIVPINAKGHILIVRQYRHGPQVISTEVPGGLVDPGEDPIDAAKRELLEETGCVADRFEAVSPLYTNPARNTNRAHTFIAHNARIVQPPQQESTEDIEFEFVSREEVFRLIDEGHFAHALHVASLLLAFRQVDK
jgi:8-oxo-dGTP pyrophosphatase MutT (NUDIX family)